jgi:hypothetical protein
MLHAKSYGLRANSFQPCRFVANLVDENRDPYTMHNDLNMQSHRQLQCTAPKQRTRHDSLTACSLSNGLQPFALPPQAATSPQTAAGLTTPPSTLMQSSGMERIDSQQSATSNQQQFHNQHRGSMGHDSAPGGIDMSRTVTQYSNLSASQYSPFTPAQQHSTQYQFDFIGHSPSNEYRPFTSRRVDIDYDTLQISAGMGSTFAFNLDDTHSVRETDSRSIAAGSQATGNVETFEQSFNLVE